ncbi:hypothetical protein [Streptomyces viridochromogenes]|uniref:Uncharacterized protein n=1 Tax=Streptomyces viridochromogenes Tue57 TaxID=1160705 RepID=L8PMN0_STRVR|nr:hypothetical protein [Streptomyces viridochromogenes]ELS57249.1 hypothetical protein STVIR_1690 [Streptomyces viridochromogenes Tue57]
MKLHLAVPLTLLALLIAASGVAAVTRGWVLPTNRKPVGRPRLYGWGQLLVAFALCCQAVFGFVISDSGSRQWGTLTGSALLLAGIVVMMVSHRNGGHRQDGSAL